MPMLLNVRFFEATFLIPKDTFRCRDRNEYAEYAVWM